MDVISLSIIDLALGAVLVVALAGVTVAMRLGVARQLVVAAVRTALQLLLVGLVLKFVFAIATLWSVALMALVMLGVAGYEAVARQQRRFRGNWGYSSGTFSMFLSSFVVTVLALAVIVRPDPWFTPQYAIPLLGMILGNTMTAVALSLDRLTQLAWQNRGEIEQRLMLGHAWHDAIADVRRDSIRTGLIPIINAMAAAGIVSLPGMMTGQILAGTPPTEAVKYQVLVMFLIAAGTGFGAVLAVALASRRLTDERERLRLDRLEARLH